MNTVIVTADNLGNVLGISQNNPDYGYVRVEQFVMEYDESGWLQKKTRSALIKGKVADLQLMGYKAGQTLPGRIVVKESLTPFGGDAMRNLKYAGKTGVVCTLDDQPIYRDTYYTPNPDTQDVFVPHNNGEQIREAQRAQNDPKAGIKSPAFTV